MSFNNVSERHDLSRNKSQKWYLIIILNTINIIQFDTYFNFLQT
ncbi:transcriptional regulator, partial [Staphylococcus epidermidis]